ncbi:IAP-2 [Agrotis segetum nucleopolyhedrovirus A]|uniref:IAP-2 n=1 Tax=Agrotis segetum nuclear polyhedrosis virus TaxID=1962501 RepID=Q287H7_NPVAS|nr:IAP-2 [Agrotis segetum nucleopolyhedrovirus A]AAZ38261.1 IAP-2 [Agrotis segetum nucleopolyhedrovirus A]
MHHTTMQTLDLAPPSFYKNLRARLATYENSCLTQDYIRNLANTGIYRDSNNGYKCAFCPLYLKKLDAHQLKYHTFSTCPVATRRLFANETLRKESFKKFKTARVHYKSQYEELAKNGFYYYGTKVEIRCSDCHIVIVKLHREDNVEQIHRLWSPECYFNSPSAPPPDDDFDEDNANAGESIGLYPQLPLHEDDTIVNFGASSPAATADDIMCKICFERERDTCFLPCRHVSTCSDCAKRCKVCCICREKIKNTMEIFLQ